MKYTIIIFNNINNKKEMQSVQLFRFVKKCL